MLCLYYIPHSECRGDLQNIEEAMKKFFANNVFLYKLSIYPFLHLGGPGGIPYEYPQTTIF